MSTLKTVNSKLIRGIPKWAKVKFSFFEKATKIWCNLPHGFDATKECQNLEADYLWSSQKS